MALALVTAGTLALAGCGGGESGDGADASVTDDRPDAGTGTDGPDGSPGSIPDAGASRPDAGGDADGTYAITGETQVMVSRGGDGGEPYAVACPDGTIAVGVTGRSGTGVDAIALDCRELRADGTLSDTAEQSGTAGGDGGDEFAEACPGGEAIVAVNGRSAAEIDAIGIECAPVVEWIDTGTGRHAVGEVHGGDGGTGFFDLCSREWFVHELHGTAADRVDSLQAGCAEAENRDVSQRDYTLATATEKLPARGGDGGEPFTIACPDDSVATGLVGRSGTGVDQIQFACSTIGTGGALTETGTSPATGGGGGEAFREDCAVDEAIVGLRGRAASELDAIGISCAPIDGWVDDASGFHPWGRVHGGDGGDAFDDECPAGKVIQTVTGRSNQRIDAVQASCIEIE